MRHLLYSYIWVQPELKLLSSVSSYQHFLSALYVSIIKMLSGLALIIHATLKHRYYLHFTDEETGSEIIDQGQSSCI